jgi:hypothetical protein
VPISQKTASRNAPRYQDHNDRFNLVMAQIQLLDSGDVYLTAHRIHACLVALEHEALSAQIDQNVWRAKRTPLSTAVAEYQRAARAALKSPAIAGLPPWLEAAIDQP